MSYAYGVFTDEAIQIAMMLGLSYGRTVYSTKGFTAPVDFMRWNPTCHHNEAIADRSLADIFLSEAPPKQTDVFYIWGHSYEFDREGNWERMEELCRRLGGHDDIWYTTNIDYMRYKSAVKSLVYSTDLSMVMNLSSIKIWMECDGEIRAI